MIKAKKLMERTLFFYIPLGVTLIFTLVPFLWAISNSLKREQDVISSVIKYIPSPMTFENYIKVWTVNKFSSYFSNSLYISVISVIFILVLSVANAYALSRYNFKGKNIFMIILLSTQLIPVILLITPLLLMFKRLGLLNTRASIIIFYIVHQVPFNTLLMKGFVDGIPKSIDEAAMIDGATRIKTIMLIITPLILPGIVATSAFAFVGCWNEFMVAFSFITSAKFFTIPIGLKFMIGEYSVEYASLAAGSIIGLIPPVLLFAYIQKYLVQGLASGSVKG